MTLEQMRCETAKLALAELGVNRPHLEIDFTDFGIILQQIPMNFSSEVTRVG